MRRQYVRKPLDILTRSHINHLAEDWCDSPDHFPDFISKEPWSPNLSPLDDILWHELAESMNWKIITTKAILIDEIKRSIKKIWHSVLALYG